MLSFLAGLFGVVGPIVIQVFKWFGFTEDQARDWMKRISQAQAPSNVPNSQDQLSEAQLEIDAQRKADLEKGAPPQ